MDGVNRSTVCNLTAQRMTNGWRWSHHRARVPPVARQHAHHVESTSEDSISCDEAESASDPRAVYARLRGLRLMTTIYDVTLLLEIHDKKGIVVQRAFRFAKARKAESFCGHRRTLSCSPAQN